MKERLVEFVTQYDRKKYGHPCRVVEGESNAHKDEGLVVSTKEGHVFFHMARLRVLDDEPLLRDTPFEESKVIEAAETLLSFQNSRHDHLVELVSGWEACFIQQVEYLLDDQGLLDPVFLRSDIDYLAKLDCQISDTIMDAKQAIAEDYDKNDIFVLLSQLCYLRTIIKDLADKGKADASTVKESK